MEMARQKKEITNDDVEKGLGVSDATAQRYLQELESQGKLVQIGTRGKYVKYAISQRSTAGWAVENHTVQPPSLQTGVCWYEDKKYLSSIVWVSIKLKPRFEAGFENPLRRGGNRVATDIDIIAQW